MLSFFSKFSKKKKSSSNSPTRKAKKIINTFKEKGFAEEHIEGNLEKMNKTAKDLFTRRPKKNSSSKKNSTSKRRSMSSDKKQKIKQIEENFKGTLHGHLEKVVDINKLQDAIDSVQKKTDVFKRKKNMDDDIVISVTNLDTGKVSKTVPVIGNFSRKNAKGGRKTRKIRY